MFGKITHLYIYIFIVNWNSISSNNRTFGFSRPRVKSTESKIFSTQCICCCSR